MHPEASPPRGGEAPRHHPQSSGSGAEEGRSGHRRPGSASSPSRFTGEGRCWGRGADGRRPTLASHTAASGYDSASRRPPPCATKPGGSHAAARGGGRYQPWGGRSGPRKGGSIPAGQPTRKRKQLGLPEAVPCAPPRAQRPPDWEEPRRKEGGGRQPPCEARSVTGGGGSALPRPPDRRSSVERGGVVEEWGEEGRELRWLPVVRAATAARRRATAVAGEVA